MGGKSAAPPPPDYTGAAVASAEASGDITESQTWANRPTVNTPFGQQTWAVTPQWDPVTGQYINTWESNVNLTPEQQTALESQQDIQAGRSGIAQGLLGRAEQEYADPMDWNSLTQLAGGPTVPGQTNLPGLSGYSPEAIQRGLSTEGLQNIDPSSRYFDEAGDAIYNRFSSRMEPQFERDFDRTRTQLYNTGLREGDEAYDEQIRQLRQSQSDAREQAGYQATIGAGQEASRMFGIDAATRGQQFGEREAGGAFANQAAQQALQQQLGIGGQQFGQGLALAGQEEQIGQNRFGNQLTAGNYQNQLRQQQISEEMQRRGFSINEINSILSGQQVGLPGMPQFNTAGRSTAPDFLGAAGQEGNAALQAYGIQQAGQQGTMQGLGSLAAAAAMMFSDRRLKKNIKHIGYHEKGYKLYRFDYIWESDGSWQIGIMADEVPPEYVFIDPVSGYQMVDYEGLLHGT